ncbi:hypothetical protein FEM08_07850 [Flavobacterium gilvum]|nr:hypothetical protein FEM08_07850 [Flavobacterium gilvum]
MAKANYSSQNTNPPAEAGVKTIITNSGFPASASVPLVPKIKQKFFSQTTVCRNAK